MLVEIFIETYVCDCRNIHSVVACADPKWLQLCKTVSLNTVGVLLAFKQTVLNDAVLNSSYDNNR